ncbi:ribonuclease P protein component [Natranaerofaba carboxydovora]|uniref:ribonuclease P protein component n=1 Tax=Natranaerofaba carboxydovora TaxID=2742683 RepID=UPI001F136A06|nr:ribonuclease P protein component [Natranaerofaba carboxydovora]UMZ75186.1 Ribonuclease P protein component [Natranaerofaba carboxydovora]
MKSTKITTLKNSKEFRDVLNNGKSYVTKNLVLYVKKNEKNYNRLGIIISKKVGKSVVRNRIRRLLKEVYRKDEIYLKSGFDLVFIVRHRAYNLDYKTACKEFNKLIKKAKLNTNRNFN